MLKDLADRGELPSTILEMANKLRFFRNIGAHASDVDLSKEDAKVLKELCDAILEYVYEAPAMLKQVEDRISQLKS